MTHKSFTKKLKLISNGVLKRSQSFGLTGKILPANVGIPKLKNKLKQMVDPY